MIINNYNSKSSIILWGYPFYIYMCLRVFCVPTVHNVSVHICVGISNLFFVLHSFYVNFLTVLPLFYVNYLTISVCAVLCRSVQCYISAYNGVFNTKLSNIFNNLIVSLKIYNTILLSIIYFLQRYIILSDFFPSCSLALC